MKKTKKELELEQRLEELNKNGWTFPNIKPKELEEFGYIMFPKRELVINDNTKVTGRTIFMRSRYSFEMLFSDNFKDIIVSDVSKFFSMFIKKEILKFLVSNSPVVEKPLSNQNLVNMINSYEGMFYASPKFKAELGDRIMDDKGNQYKVVYDSALKDEIIYGDFKNINMAIFDDGKLNVTIDPYTEQQQVDVRVIVVTKMQANYFHNGDTEFNVLKISQ